MSTRATRRLYVEANGRCHWCGAVTVLPRRGQEGALPDDLATTDHVVPACRGGKDDDSNRVLACRWCNQHKGDSDPETWERSAMLAKRRTLVLLGPAALVRVRRRRRRA